MRETDPWDYSPSLQVGKGLSPEPSRCIRNKQSRLLFVFLENICRQLHLQCL